MRLASYTVATDTPAELLQTMDRVQFTLNSRIHPAKRKSVETVQNFREKFSHGQIFVHYDFVYIASRYMFLNDGTKKAIIRELRELMSIGTGISGVVMHTDFPLRKDLLTASSDRLVHLLDEFYDKPLFNKQVILDSVSSIHSDQILTYNLENFVKDLFVQGWNPGCPLYLENTTKTGSTENGTSSLIDFVECFQEKYPYLGLCFDTEHAYAATGHQLSDCIFNLLIKNLMVHLNPIPSGVKPKSGLDRHSETTLFECSVYKPEVYVDFIDELDYNHIPYIRECYQETILREQQQLKEWENQ